MASIRQYISGYRNIYIVGDHPGFDGEFIHIPVADRWRNKQDNIRLKLEAACAHEEISDTFCMMNDDYIFIKPFDIQSTPFYYNTNLAKMYLSKRKNGHYKQALLNTLIHLTDRGLPVKHFDIHAPILYNKQKFLEVMAQFNWNIKDGYVIKSLYSNSVSFDREFLSEQLCDPKVTQAHETVEATWEVIKDWFMFSFDDHSLNDALIKLLVLKFPEVENEFVN